MNNPQEVSGAGTPLAPAPKTEIPRVSDPVRFMNDFESSDYFRAAYGKFFEGKTLASDVTDEEKYTAFSESEIAKLALLDFGEKEERFHYDSSYFPLAIRLAIDDYIDQTRDYGKMNRGDSTQDEIISADLLKTTYHDIAAHGLKDAGFVGSYRLGKAFARLILIDRGLETFESSRESDINKVRRKLGINF